MSTSKENDPRALTPHGEILSKVGAQTEAATAELERVLREASTPDALRERLIPEIGPVLETWTNGEAASVVRAIGGRISEGADPDTAALTRWIRMHDGDSESVIDCLKVDPPDGITIIQLLSRAGSQKLVFRATWQIAQRDVVVKRFVGQETERLVDRESRTHPLSMRHDNIIETHLLRNESGEPFLVERKLSHVLNDEWQSKGVDEAANLLRDIAAALAFLRERNLVHGDVKPDNIGVDGGRYILLDFGICRKADEFQEDASATGSLRTRAPELLRGEAGHGFASDVWALGATVFNALVGRFPLFNADETPPRVSHPDQRAQYEALLAKRASEEWKERVEQGLEQVEHDAMRSVVGAALAEDPTARVGVNELVDRCQRELAAFVRARDGGAGLSPTDELDQLLDNFPDAEVLRVMSRNKRLQLETLVERLEATQALHDTEASRLEELKRLIATA